MAEHPAPKTRAEYEAQAKELIQFELLNDADPGVRAIASITEPPAEAIQRVADALQRKDANA